MDNCAAACVGAGVVPTTPLSIVEDLIPVALAISNREQGALPLEQVEALLRARPEGRHKPDAAVSEDTTETLYRPNLNELLQ